MPRSLLRLRHPHRIRYSLTPPLGAQRNTLEAIDGILAQADSGATLNARHERASTVLTSNKGFEDWGGVLGDEVMPAALIDRLLRHCHIVNIRSNSYRMRAHQDLLRATAEQRGEGSST